MARADRPISTSLVGPVLTVFVGVVVFAVATFYRDLWLVPGAVVAAAGGGIASAGAMWTAVRSERYYRLTRSRQVRVLVRPGCVVSDTRANKLRQAEEVFYVDRGTAWSLKRKGYVHIIGKDPPE